MGPVEPSHESALDRVERLVRHAEYLRQINSNKAFSCQRKNRWLNGLTVAMASAVTFIAFSGVDRLYGGLSGIITIRWPKETFELVFNVLILSLVMLTISSLIFQLPERAMRHLEAIRRLTEYIGPYEDMVRSAHAGAIVVTLDDAARARDHYLLMAAALPPSTDKEFLRAKRDYTKKKSMSRGASGVAQKERPESPTQYVDRIVRQNQDAMEILKTIWALDGEAELFLCGGTLRNLIWDDKHGYAVNSPSDDVDIAYFDSGNTDESQEKEIEALLEAKMPNLKWDVKNQARMQLTKGLSPTSLRDALRQFPETASAVAIRLAGETLEILCPFGLDDLVSLVVAPSSADEYAAYRRRAEAKEWRKRWPQLIFSDEARS